MDSLTLKVFQIVGYKNSGKTTLMCHLIESLHSEGYKVATLKHHAHAEPHSLRNPDTDTGKHLLKGAMAAALAGPELVQIDCSEEPPVKAYIDFYSHFNIDVLLIEGFKQSSYPKVVLLRSEEDYESLKDLENIQAFIAAEKDLALSGVSPLFYRDDALNYIAYIKKWLEGQT